jgi:hypothetical protein
MNHLPTYNNILKVSKYKNFQLADVNYETTFKKTNQTVSFKLQFKPLSEIQIYDALLRKIISNFYAP